MKRLRDREIEDADGPLMIAPELLDHSLITAHESFHLRSQRCSGAVFTFWCCGGLGTAFCVAILEIELLDALVDRELRQELTMVKMRHSGLRVAQICSKIIRSKLLVDFRLKFFHLFNYDSPLLAAHLFNLGSLYLVLGHVGDLEHYVRVL